MWQKTSNSNSTVRSTCCGPQAASWIDENIADEAQWFGTALAVEPRYCPDIVAGMIDDGLAVYIGENLVTGAS